MDGNSVKHKEEIDNSKAKKIMPHTMVVEDKEKNIWVGLGNPPCFLPTEGEKTLVVIPSTGPYMKQK